MRPWWLLVLLAGCMDASPEATPEEPAPAPVPGSWAPVLIAERDVPVGGITEFDVLCAFGGTDFYNIPRDAAPAGTGRLVFEVRSGPTTTGVQAGYERAETIHWFPIVQAGEQTFEIDAPDDANALAFKYQLNTVNEEDCYTGASHGDYAIRVYAAP